MKSVTELDFKEWFVEEGHWDAIKAGFKAGCKVYKEKRRKDEKQKLVTKLLDSKGEAEKAAAKELVGHRTRRREENLVKWMMEHGKYISFSRCISRYTD